MANYVNVNSEYAKDNNLKREDVAAILNWVSSQPHLPVINEFQAIAFLKENYYYIEPTKKTIETYFSLKNLWPDLFVGRILTNPLEKGLLDVILHVPLPKKTPEGYYLSFMKILSSDIAGYELSQCLKYLDVAIMSNLYQNGTSEGILMVLDVKNLPYAFLLKLDFNAFKRYFYYLQEVIPIHFKGFHFIASCAFMDELIAIVRSAVPKPLLPFVYVHNSVEDLEKYIPIELLPEDYGGSVDSVDLLKGKWEQHLLENVPLFEWEDRQIVDEDKRPSKKKGSYDNFEVENGLSVDL